NDPYYDRKISDLQRRYDEQYGRIDEVEVQIDDVQSQIRSIRQEKISGDNIYRLLLAFDQVYEAASEVERKEFMRAFIERIELFPEKQPDGNWIRKIIFNFPVPVNGIEVKELPLENETMVETVILLSREPSEHPMRLSPEPFEMIKSGRKTIELRLWDEKRQNIKIGDTIVFTNTASGETFRTTVLRLHRFDSFEALYHSLPLLKCGYTEENLAAAKASDMEKYYSADEQLKYGVVGIELAVSQTSDTQ
ncbi:ASCH domain-containing protein, partial [uncultured Gemmiger sp.]|uniref:ASCH domain-containing protein n=1 Tax=uncultured Gemmiger sp. TaxID=1623490 RepID=UPI0025DD0390